MQCSGSRADRDKNPHSGCLRACRQANGLVVCLPTGGPRVMGTTLTSARCLQSSGGEVADEATPRLGDIRTRRRANGQELRRRTEQWARDLGQRGVSEHGQPMVRRNRQCVSVKRGQQVSGTGCTLSWVVPTVQHQCCRTAVTQHPPAQGTAGSASRSCWGILEHWGTWCSAVGGASQSGASFR